MTSLPWMAGGAMSGVNDQSTMDGWRCREWGPVTSLPWMAGGAMSGGQ